MAISLNEVSQYLGNLGIKIQHRDDDTSTLVYGVSGTNQFLNHIVLQENGEMFVAHAINLFEPQVVANNPNVALVARYLLKQAYDYKFGSMEMDDDGEIRIGVEIPWEDGTLTERQFKRIIQFLTENVDTLISEVNEILTTGELPESPAGSMTEQMRALVTADPVSARQFLDNPDASEEHKALIRQLLDELSEPGGLQRQIRAAISRGDIDTAQRLAASATSDIPDSI